MTFFDWRAAEGDVVTKAIWIYFVATILLTASVVSGWAFLTRNTRNKVEIELSPKNQAKIATLV